MPQVSSIKKLPTETRRLLDERIRSHAHTLDELKEWLEEVEPQATISRSAIHRYMGKFRLHEQAIDMVVDLAGRGLGENDTTEVADLMLELARLRIREQKVLDRLRDLGVL